VQRWLSVAADDLGDMAAALKHATALRDAAAERGPCRDLATGLNWRAAFLANMGRYAEGAGEAGRALAVAREIGYPLGEARALAELSYGALEAGDHDGAVRLARQSVQITTGLPGSQARWYSYHLAIVLIETGDLAAAEPVCAATLASARDAGDVHDLIGLLPRMVSLDLAAGRFQDAAAHLRESLQLITRTSGWQELGNCLDRSGLLCAATGRFADAVTVWAAMAVLLRHQQNLDVPRDARRREEPLRQARQALGPDRTRAAEERGTAMSTATAAEYALMLTDPGPQYQAAAAAGKLSARERELVTLVAKGRTDAQIAAELYISIRTVRSHLDRIRDKTGCRRRADLTRLALSAELA
jgi:DNA-binding CsgD family transcriptional regulator